MNSRPEYGSVAFLKAKAEELKARRVGPEIAAATLLAYSAMLSTPASNGQLQRILHEVYGRRLT